MIKDNNVLFLIGAGCSVEAKIPMSEQMVSEIEGLLHSDDSWKKYGNLYNYLKSSILFSDGILGVFTQGFNVERLLVVISEIEKKEKNIIFPFIGNWHSLLVELAGSKFEHLTGFKELIVKKLHEWILPENYDKAEYYTGFVNFKNEIGRQLRVFTLNYDLCFEKIVGRNNIYIEDGFNPNTHEWDYDNFALEEAKDFFLYKLHGSIDWYKDIKEPEKLKKREHPTNKPELIFGVQAKLQSEDPYLFYTSQFRQYILHKELKLLIVIGYSFADDYINKIIRKGLIKTDSLILLVVTYINMDSDEKNSAEVIVRKKSIIEQLNLPPDYINKIEIEINGAGNFLNESLKQENLTQKYLFVEDNPIK